MECLDVLDLERVDVEVVETEKSNGVLSVSTTFWRVLSVAEMLTLTSKPRANALTKSAPFWTAPLSTVCPELCDRQ